jgi:hypothetical protein
MKITNGGTRLVFWVPICRADPRRQNKEKGSDCPNPAVAHVVCELPG